MFPYHEARFSSIDICSEAQFVNKIEGTLWLRIKFYREILPARYMQRKLTILRTFHFIWRCYLGNKLIIKKIFTLTSTPCGVVYFVIELAQFVSVSNLVNTKHFYYSKRCFSDSWVSNIEMLTNHDFKKQSDNLN